jgi:hypothetical protein
MRGWLIISITLLLTACSSTPINQQRADYLPQTGNPSNNRAEVFIQAGHEGRSSGRVGASSQYGREIKWTPVVADAATRYLRQAGISVIRADANWRSKAYIKLALFIHFDGVEGDACRTGASIGYDDSSDRPAAMAWKRLYSSYFPYNWRTDNFTRNLSRYYMFKYTRTKDAELVLELGAIGCRAQALWLKPRLEKLGQLVAYFAARRLGYGDRIQKPIM